jgi:glycerol-3-phosphate acyltransferase PlsX
LGNVEGVDVFRGDCDVVVCDGFVGNIVLKVSEGLAERLVDLFKMGLEQSLQGLRQRLRAVMAGSGGGAGAAGGGSTAGGGSAAGGDGMEALFRESFGGMLKKIDYSEYGGAPLLGVNGVVIIAHGRSDAKAIGNAVRAAQRMSEANVNQRITEEIRALSLAKDSEPAEGAAVSLDG